jgi:hypothetical protein
MKKLLILLSGLSFVLSSYGNKQPEQTKNDSADTAKTIVKQEPPAKPVEKIGRVQCIIGEGNKVSLQHWGNLDLFGAPCD